MYPESVADIFEALKPEAREFVLKEVKGNNKESKDKLVKAIVMHKVETKSFPGADIDFLTFDWCSIEMDRNWWWQMQALPFLDWFAQSHRLFDAAEQATMVDYCLAALQQWLAQEPNSENSPLRWHDHATAYRLTNIVNWMLVLSENPQLVQQVFDASPEIKFSEVLNQHLLWLTEEKNYSQYTNHGFDQALAVYSLGLYVGCGFWVHEVSTAESRLVDEVSFAFTEEGVHKENSPGYHVFMMRRLEKLVRLERIGGSGVAAEARKIQEGAERFLGAITLPDGTLPMVGDTRGSQKGAPEELVERPSVYDFSKSGYVVVKGLFQGKPYYLLVKNCHESNYHRHDDDLSIYLYFDGKVLLADGGLGSHNEKDEKRIGLRSYRSHCIPYVEGKALRRPGALDFKPTLKVQDDLIVGRSAMFGKAIERTVDFKRISEGVINVADKIDESVSLALCANIISEVDVVKSKEECGGWSFIDDDRSLASLRIGAGHISEKSDRILSREYGKYESVHGLSICSEGGRDINFVVQFG